MRSAIKGQTVKVITGQYAGRRAEVLRGANLYNGTGRAKVRIVRMKDGYATTVAEFSISTRSLRASK